MGGLKYICAIWIRISQSYGKSAPFFIFGLDWAVLTNGSVLLLFIPSRYGRHFHSSYEEMAKSPKFLW